MSLSSPLDYFAIREYRRTQTPTKISRSEPIIYKQISFCRRAFDGPRNYRSYLLSIYLLSVEIRMPFRKGLEYICIYFYLLSDFK